MGLNHQLIVEFIKGQIGTTALDYCIVNITAGIPRRRVPRMIWHGLNCTNAAITPIGFLILTQMVVFYSTE
jgi:hypothetical protein